MLYNSPTSTFNFKKKFRGLYPWAPVKRGRGGERRGEGEGKGGRPPIHVSGYAAVMTGSPFCGYNTT